jgi:hypothetical protein
MQVQEIRQDLKTHNKETFKRDGRMYKAIMSDKTICEDDDTIENLKSKFKKLINYKEYYENHNCQLVI